LSKDRSETIIKYVKDANGWRFAPVVKRPNGSIHWDHVLIGGIAQAHREGKYFVRVDAILQSHSCQRSARPKRLFHNPPTFLRAPTPTRYYTHSTAHINV